MTGLPWRGLLTGGLVLASAASVRAGLPPRDVTLDDLQYEEYIEPFVVNPPALLRYPEPMPAPPPLLTPFDPLIGQTPSAATSRIARPGGRAVVYLPVLEAKVGQTVDVPVTIELGPAIRATRLVMDYNPDVLKAIEVLHPDWPDIIFNSNVEPDPGALKQNRIFAVAASSEPWTGKRPLVLRFQVVGAGESYLRADAFEYADAGFDMHPNVFRNGLIRAMP